MTTTLDDTAVIDCTPANDEAERARVDAAFEEYDRQFGTPDWSEYGRWANGEPV